MFMLLRSRCLCDLLRRDTKGMRIHSNATPSSAARNSSTDELGLPLSPPWSVHTLLSSYPSPTLSKATLMRLHDLAALAPPAEDSPEFEALKGEMEELVRLVEAVKESPNLKEQDWPPDGRIWPRNRSVALTDVVESAEIPHGQGLLTQAHRIKNGYFIVDRQSAKS